ncbi:MAG: SMC family ATPase [Chloracidobacterium sp.]|nr:SMC family ATPase [Chloracidobacterium sp.]
MQITRVELQNIKSYASAAYDFQPGTTAITGSNGAGKTTIIEAIAWVLFDLLEYKKDDFIKRGEKKGSVNVAFISGVDEREYSVHRDTGTGYYVTDPRLGLRIADKKEEVLRFLWQHLGLEPGTDLRSLFRQAIGVPQGTFTAIFLDGATERKSAFDRLLKVEEYRQAAEKLRDTVRFVDTQLMAVREDIARCEGELKRAEDVAKEHAAIATEFERLSTELTLAEKEAERLHKIVSTLDDLEKIEVQKAHIAAEQKQNTERLERIASAKAEIKMLMPKTIEQTRLEEEAAAFRSKVTLGRGLKDQFETAAKRLARLRENFKQNQADIGDAEVRARGAADVAILEKRSADIVAGIAAAGAELDRDERFQKEIRDGLCPILSQKCLNLKPGETLEMFISSQFEELRGKIDDLEKERKEVVEALAAARESQRYAAMLDTLRKREAELTEDGTALRRESEELSRQIAELPAFEAKLADAQASLDRLGDPKSRVRFLEHETAAEGDVHAALRRIGNSLSEVESQRAVLLAGLQHVSEIDIREGYDPAMHRAQRQLLTVAEKHLAELAATLAAIGKRKDQIEAELAHFEKVRIGLEAGLREKARLDTVAEATAFIRDTLKEAAPRIARNYVYHVSLEANLIFREITGNAERTLKWGEDYAISIEEDRFERPFASLSGGEQMAAALAVRLALLKQVTDIRIAFFDEPTTNLDAERRENLAVEIGRISHFDQLFIISHDETFDSYVDNVISVGD